MVLAVGEKRRGQLPEVGEVAPSVLALLGQLPVLRRESTWWAGRRAAESYPPETARPAAGERRSSASGSSR